MWETVVVFRKFEKEQKNFGKYWYRVFIEWYWPRTTKLFGGKPVLVPLCYPKILILIGLGLIRGLRGDRPETNPLNHNGTCLAPQGIYRFFIETGIGGSSFLWNLVITLQSTWSTRGVCMLGRNFARKNRAAAKSSTYPISSDRLLWCLLLRACFFLPYPILSFSETPSFTVHCPVLQCTSFSFSRSLLHSSFPF